jgi:3',5'-cyclic AMP phosphodiesterase CpdA
MKLLHLTDSHMTGFHVCDGHLYPRIPEHAWWALARRYDLMAYLLPMALKQAQADFAPDVILMGGDLVDDGFGAYGRDELIQVRDLVHELAQVPVIWLYGNHDGPQNQFAELFGDLNWTQDIAGVRLVGLNSGSMEPEEEVESSAVALDELRTALETNEGLPVVVALHQWIVPTEVRGYSFARADDALALIADDPHVVAVISGHYHDGQYEERYAIHYCTSRSLAEPPFCYTTYDFAADTLTLTEYALAPAERRFAPTRQEHLPLR